MTLDQEQRFGVLIPDGKNIRGVVEGILTKKGFRFEMRTNGSPNLHADVENSPVSLTVQGSRVIPRLVDTGRFLAGFDGSDRVAEYLVSLRQGGSTSRLEELQRFNVFPSSLRLSLLVRSRDIESGRYQQTEDLEGQKVVTTYPALAVQFFQEKGVSVVIDSELDGKEEGLVASGDAEGAVVIVNTGGQRDANRLREIAVIMGGNDSEIKIQPVLVWNPEALQEIGRQRFSSEFVERLQNGSRLPRTLGNLWGILPPM